MIADILIAEIMYCSFASIRGDFPDKVLHIGCAVSAHVMRVTGLNAQIHTGSGSFAWPWIMPLTQRRTGEVMWVTGLGSLNLGQYDRYLRIYEWPLLR
jgi:hypothetical protein